MSEFRILIEGEGAVSATEDLMLIPDISGTWQPVEDDPSERDGGGTLATVATIVGIVSGSMTVAEKLHKWYGKRQQNDPQARIEKVLIERDDGQRLLLKDATVEQIKTFLD